MKVELNSDTLFRELSTRIKGKPELTARVLAHVRAVSPHTTLVAFHNNGASEDEKAVVYGVCLKAILTGDFSGLKGEVPKGQAQTPENVTPATKPDSKAVSFAVACKAPGDTTWSYNRCRFATKEEAEAYGKDLAARWTGLAAWEVHPTQDAVTAKWGDPATPGLLMLDTEKKPEAPPPVIPPVKPEVKQDTNVTATAPAAPAPGVDPKVAGVLAALQQLMAPAAPAHPALDEEAVKAIVKKVLAEEIQKAVHLQLQAQLRTELGAVMRGAFPPTVLE